MLGNKKSRSSRLLGGSFLASLILNFGWMAWVAHSDIFGSSRAMENLHETRIKVFKPVPVKPKRTQVQPLPAPPPPPPKPPKERPKFKPLKTITHTPKPPLPRPQPAQAHSRPIQAQPRPAPARPQPRMTQAHSQPEPVMTTPQPEPAVQRPVQVARTPNIHTQSPLTLPAAPPNSGLTLPINPGPVPAASPIRPQPPATDQHPQSSAPAGSSNPPKAPEQDRPKPTPAVTISTPKPVTHPEGWLPVDVQEAAALGSFDSPEVPQEDADGIAGKTVRVTWVVDENGHAGNVRTTKSSGNREVDRICEAIIKRMRFRPAIQDHLYREAHMSWDFVF